MEGKTITRFQDRRWDNLEEDLIAAAEETPTALLVDEAHSFDSVDRTLYRQFLNVAQSVAEKAPFLPVLAGTPGLPDALGEINATFIERADHLGVGLLEQSEAAAAIREPLTEDGFKITDDALSFVVADSQHYPFFLQRWGYELWDTAYDGDTGELTMADARRVKDTVDANKIDLYEGRYAELSANKRLRAAAAAIAAAFVGQDALDSDHARMAIEKALSPLLPAREELAQSANVLLRRLVHLGYVWRPPGKTAMRPGIPSLMDYTRSKPLGAGGGFD